MRREYDALMQSIFKNRCVRVLVKTIFFFFFFVLSSCFFSCSCSSSSSSSSSFSSSSNNLLSPIDRIAEVSAWLTHQQRRQAKVVVLSLSVPLPDSHIASVSNFYYYFFSLPRSSRTQMARVYV